jgi:hypothetical protein
MAAIVDPVIFVVLCHFYVAAYDTQTIHGASAASSLFGGNFLITHFDRRRISHLLSVVVVPNNS